VSRALLCALLITLVWGERALSAPVSEPEGFDPILDAPPSLPEPGLRVEAISSARSGFIVEADAGAYFGVSSSYKASDLSTLYGGTRPRFGFALGGRLELPVEVSLGVALGFGETYERRNFDNALDVFSELKLSYVPLDLKGWSLGASLGLLLATYDVEDGSVSQIAFGPELSLRLAREVVNSNQLYLDFSWAPIYNTTAYHLRDPTEEELEENPDAFKFKVKGEWGHLFMLSLGVRLSGF